MRSKVCRQNNNSKNCQSDEPFQTAPPSNDELVCTPDIMSLVTKSDLMCYRQPYILQLPTPHAKPTSSPTMTADNQPLPNELSAATNTFVLPSNPYRLQTTSPPYMAQECGRKRGTTPTPCKNKKLENRALQEARIQLKDQVLKQMHELCQHVVAKLNKFISSTAYQSVSNYTNIKDLYLHLSYLCRYTMDRFKTLYDKCTINMKQCAMYEDRQSVGRINSSGDEDDLEIIEDNQMVIDLDSDTETTTTKITVPRKKQPRKTPHVLRTKPDDPSNPEWVGCDWETTSLLADVSLNEDSDILRAPSVEQTLDNAPIEIDSDDAEEDVDENTSGDGTFAHDRQTSASEPNRNANAPSKKTNVSEMPGQPIKPTELPKKDINVGKYDNASCEIINLDENSLTETLNKLNDTVEHSKRDSSQEDSDEQQKDGNTAELGDQSLTENNDDRIVDDVYEFIYLEAECLAETQSDGPDKETNVTNVADQSITNTMETTDGYEIILLLDDGVTEIPVKINGSHPLEEEEEGNGANWERENDTNPTKEDSGDDTLNDGNTLNDGEVETVINSEDRRKTDRKGLDQAHQLDTENNDDFVLSRKDEVVDEVVDLLENNCATDIPAKLNDSDSKEETEKTTLTLQKDTDLPTIDSQPVKQSVEDTQNDIELIKEVVANKNGKTLGDLDYETRFPEKNCCIDTSGNNETGDNFLNASKEPSGAKCVASLNNEIGDSIAETIDHSEEGDFKPTEEFPVDETVLDSEHIEQPPQHLVGPGDITENAISITDDIALLCDIQDYNIAATNCDAIL